jgi:hypothetical protein
MPATAVGSANGRSTMASSSRRPGKRVAHQHPGDDDAEDDVEGGGEQRRAEAQPERGEKPRVGDDPLNAAQSSSNVLRRGRRSE